MTPTKAHAARKADMRHHLTSSLCALSESRVTFFSTFAPLLWGDRSTLLLSFTLVKRCRYRDTYVDMNAHPFHRRMITVHTRLSDEWAT